MKTELIGKKTRRVDALAKVTGRAQYTADLILPGMLHAALARSPHPHAKLKSIDVQKALELPGVEAVATGQDSVQRFGPMIKDQPFLAINRVRYVGEPVAAVAAIDEATAQMAAGLIEVEYEELPAVFDPFEAGQKDAPLIHPGLESYQRSPKFVIEPGSNFCTVKSLEQGDLKSGWAEADEVFEHTFSIHPVAHTPMETHVAICQFDPLTESYTFYSPTDAPHRRANEVAQALGIPLRQVRFIMPYQGGGFGGKGALVAECPLLLLSRKCPNRPIKLVYERGDELSASQTRVGALMTFKTGVKRDGSITARTADLIWDSGAYASKAPEVSNRGALTALGPYKIPHFAMRSRLVYTNKQISGAYRGFGTTQVTWGGERQLDIIAHKLGLDPLELRRKNAVDEGDPFINGQPMVGVGLKECLDKAAAGIGWDKPLEQPGGAKRRGRGIAAMLKGTNTPTESYAFIKLDADASCTVLSSSPEIGAGQHSMVALIAAETIGIPLEWITVPNPDTKVTPYDFGATSSRTTFHMGNAVKNAALKIKSQVLELAARVLQADPGELDLINGEIISKDGASQMGLPQLLRSRFGPKGGAVLASGEYSPEDSPLLKQGSGDIAPKSIFWLFVVHAIEVEVDAQTGEMEVIKVAAAHDVGKAISPLACQQQIEGAVIMGLSNAMLEEFKLHEGRVLNDSLADYKIATIKDMPQIETILVETHHPEGPYGAKGVGEPAVAPVAPALANAVQAALGIEINHLPITPEKVLAALKAEQIRKKDPA